MALKTKEKKILDVTDLFLKRNTAKLLAAIVRTNSYHHFHIHKVCSSFFFIFLGEFNYAKSMLNILRGFFFVLNWNISQQQQFYFSCSKIKSNSQFFFFFGCQPSDQVKHTHMHVNYINKRYANYNFLFVTHTHTSTYKHTRSLTQSSLVKIDFQPWKGCKQQEMNIDTNKCTWIRMNTYTHICSHMWLFINNNFENISDNIFSGICVRNIYVSWLCVSIEIVLNFF